MTINCNVENVEYSTEKDCIIGDIVTQDLKSTLLSNPGVKIDFNINTFRLMPDKTIITESPWLVELIPTTGTKVDFSLGGEYIGEVDIEEVKPVLLRAIFI